MTHKPKSTIQTLHRPGEGVLVDVIRTTEPQSYGVQFSANLSRVPVPDRRYASDIASVIANENMIKLLFGQSKVTGNGLRSLLVISMTFDAIHQLLRSLETVAERTVQLQEKLPEGRLTDITEEPQQTVALAANMIVGGFSGAESCLDCYYASPFAMIPVQNGANKLALEPVVRITLPTSTYFAIWKELKKLGPTLPSLVQETTP